MEQKPNSLEQNYTEEDLAKDMEEWRERQLSLSSNDKNKEWFQNLTETKLFNAYQNNFWGKFRVACELYNADGSVKPEQKEWAETVEKYATSGTLHQDLRKIITELGIIEQFGSTLKDDELETIKNAYIKMRGRGYSSRELTR